MSVEDSVNSEINSLCRYVQNCNGPLLEAVYKEKILRFYAKTSEAASLTQERKNYSAPRETTSWAVLKEHSRSKR